MGDLFVFWTHGVAVQVEDMGAPGLHIQRAGWGAEIRQNRDTANWFHFAMPTPLLMGDAGVNLRSVSVHFGSSHGITIRTVRVHEAAVVVFDAGDLSHDSLGSTQLDLSVPERPATGPIVICVNVEFTGDDARIVFVGARAWFGR